MPFKIGVKHGERCHVHVLSVTVYDRGWCPCHKENDSPLPQYALLWKGVRSLPPRHEKGNISPRHRERGRPTPATRASDACIYDKLGDSPLSPQNMGTPHLHQGEGPPHLLKGGEPSLVATRTGASALLTRRGCFALARRWGFALLVKWLATPSLRFETLPLPRGREAPLCVYWGTPPFVGGNRCEILRLPVR